MAKEGVGNMNIDVIPTVDEIKSEELFHKTVIIVDILRTSSTIISALANGAHYVIPVETVGQAKNLKNHNFNYLISGDRFYKKIPGFDLNNSPSEMATSPITEKTIVLTTTNGTRAIQKALKGEHVLIGGFLNGEYCIQNALTLKRDIVLLAVGDRNEFSLVDGLAVGFLIDIIKKKCKNTVEINNFGLAMFGMYKYYEDQVENIINNSQMGKKLIQQGLKDDVNISSQANLYPICPYVNNDQTITILD